MVAEQFAANQYVAICTLGAQHLYVDSVSGTNVFAQGSDGIFQDSHNVNNFLQWLIDLLVRIFTRGGSSIRTNGEYMGIETIANPTEKGVPLNDFNNSLYPIYGCPNELENGDRYSDYYVGGDLRGRLKITPNEDVYIQGNMS